MTNSATTENVQTTSGLVVSRNAMDGAEVSYIQITNITGGALYQNDGMTPIASGAFITFAQANAGLKFTPAPNLYSPVSSFAFDVQASLSNLVSGLGGGLAHATITVSPVPHAAERDQCQHDREHADERRPGADTQCAGWHDSELLPDQRHQRRDAVPQQRRDRDLQRRFHHSSPGCGWPQVHPGDGTLQPRDQLRLQRASLADSDGSGPGWVCGAGQRDGDGGSDDAERDQCGHEGEHADNQRLGADSQSQRRHGGRILPDHQYHRWNALPKRRHDGDRQQRVHHSSARDRGPQVHAGGEPV